MSREKAPELVGVATRGTPVEWWLFTAWGSGLIVTDTNGRVVHSAPVFKRYRSKLLIDILDIGGPRYLLRALNNKDEA